MDRSLSPGFVRLTQVGGTIPHHQILPIKPASPMVSGVEPELLKRDGTSVGAVGAIASYLAVWVALFNAEMGWGLCEVYSVDATTGEGTFIFAWNSGFVGTAVGATVDASIAIFSLKTTAGNILRLTAMESVLAVNGVLRPPFVADSAQDELSDFLVSDENFIVGRDGNYPFVPISIKTKTSDALLKITRP